jgi:RIO kinase 1
MSGNLDQLLEDGVIDEVLRRLKSGKEADVWLVRHREDVLAAKVYKERSQRSFKNNAGYKEGRSVRNTRTQRAMDRGSRFGQAAAEEEWKAAESVALHNLHAQGVRVPAPVLFYEGILLMQLVLDADGVPAPRLIDVQLTKEAAAEAYADLRQQAVKMLCCDLIHGDLSPYNVLLGAQGPTIIDFPQVISAAQNSTAAMFFQRDIENLRTFFAGFDPSLEARRGDGAEIWQAYVRRELTPDFVPTGRVEAPRGRGGGGHHREPWQGQQRPGGTAPGPRHHAQRGPQQRGPQQRGPQQHGQRPPSAPQQHAPRPRGGPQHHAQRPQGDPQQHAPRPPGAPQQHGQRPPSAPQQHAQRPQQRPPGPQQHAPHQHAPRPQQQAPRPEGGHPQQRGHGPARPPSGARPGGPQRPPRDSARPQQPPPRGPRPPGNGPRPAGPPAGPIVERVTRPPLPAGQPPPGGPRRPR